MCAPLTTRFSDGSVTTCRHCRHSTVFSGSTPGASSSFARGALPERCFGVGSGRSRKRLWPGIKLDAGSFLKTVDPFLQRLATPEKRQPFGFDQHRLARLGITPLIGTIILDENTSKAPDFHPVSLDQGIGHFSKKKIDDLLRLFAGKPVFSFQRLDQIPFVHGIPPDVVCDARIVKANQRLVNGRHAS
ncbi:hypothetical protein DESC_290151 [Desulfosarcina cetonica]|nr:hypothetical protein DESC_290151 [Desulfosarcina cetonica]